MSLKEQHISETYESEKGRLTGFIRKRVSSDEDAEDISQDVFLSLSTGFEDILNLSNTLSWIYAVAKKKIIDFKRKKKNFRLEDQQQLAFDGDEPLLIADIIPAIESLPDDKMMEDLIWEEILYGLELLPKNQKEVFVLHELEGLSFQDISELTGENVNTLLSRKRYAVTFLREHLGELFEIINE
jgi:RNA polymerase sigma factor (sigma-70 family)